MIVKGLTGIAILILAGCGHNVEITKPAEAQTAKIAGVSPTPAEALPAPAEPEKEAPVTVLGVFSNRKGDGEHAWGYSVELWKQGDRFYGMILGTNDLMLDGDPPTGLLEDVQYDAKTGQMSFRSKLSIANSRAVYEFKGVLTARRLKGVITTTEQWCGDCREKINVVLPRSRERSKELSGYKSLAEWQTDTDRILKFRGPRW